MRPGDLDAVHAIQDAITAEQDRPGTFEVPNWDPVTLTVVRDTLLRVAPARQPASPWRLRTHRCHRGGMRRQSRSGRV